MTAEEAGFDSVRMMDHFYQMTNVNPRTDPMPEAYTLLGALAARTTAVSLGTMVTGVTYRNPALVARAQVLSPERIVELTFNDTGGVSVSRVNHLVHHLRFSLGWNPQGDDDSPLETLDGQGYCWRPDT